MLDNLKKQAAERAVEEVKSGMVVGIGTGSTAVFSTFLICKMLKESRLDNIAGIPTSEETARIAGECGIPLAALEEHPIVDVTIDGADEVDLDLNMIKGRGGALLREKIVAFASKKKIFIVDHTKRVEKLKKNAQVPV